MLRIPMRLMGAVLVAAMMVGCGGSGSGGAAGGAAKVQPRPGEDAMKEAMGKILEKSRGKAIPGVPKPATKP